MSIRSISKVLEEALLHDGEMVDALYIYELEELLDEFIQSLRHDQDAYLFAVTVNTGDVAMVLIEADGAISINEEARTRLQNLWQSAYASNIKGLIPTFAKQLQTGNIPVNGVKIVQQRAIGG